MQIQKLLKPETVKLFYRFEIINRNKNDKNLHKIIILDFIFEENGRVNYTLNEHWLNENRELVIDLHDDEEESAVGDLGDVATYVNKCVEKSNYVVFGWLKESVIRK